ncbi:glycoside hydrolase family 71 protein [Saccharata proteae CBS 121410]|uniref:Glycoside hydrolase family 71 protein n=1 Tax=Saccharata proteae CBS 121410 TaxID=1314787 RepID=A0A9P4HZL1_9PEZI|nr:glycoside hydrolase family 71 protein [Saccharata proteae CBS 121410]
MAMLAAMVAPVVAKAVFAHVIVGNVASYTEDQWLSDMTLAQEAGIDGFVLNIASPWEDPTITQVAAAFIVANNMSTDFKLFFSFDYSADGAWDASEVTEILNEYVANYAYYNETTTNKALVSTFEGPANAGDWSDTIIPGVDGGIFFVPDWTSVGTTGIVESEYYDTIDGAFSWDMWPEGPVNVSDTNDKAWVSALGTDKAFMMGVSPWFYTDLPGYSKSWVWRGDDAWHIRWAQVLDVDPEFVEIVSWNDYGESHYVGPIWDAGIPSGTYDGKSVDAHPYVDGMPHEAWLNILPYYIAQYKTGAPTVSTEKLQFWYRLTPGDAGTTEATGDNCAGSYDINTGTQTCYAASEIVQDKVFFTALLSEAATVTVKIGDNDAIEFAAGDVGPNHFAQDFNGQTGNVTVAIVRDGTTVATATGPAISASPASGTTNFNAWVGGASA